MVSEALTERRIKAAQTAGITKRTILWDGAIVGLGLRLSPAGSAAWVFSFRTKNSKRGKAASMLTLGRWPAVGLQDARAAARIQAGRIAKGEDPIEELRQQRLRPRRILERALDDFETTLKRRRLVNAAVTMSALRRGLKPFMKREVEALSRAVIVAEIEKLEAAGKPGAAGDLRKATRSFLEWSLTRGLVPFNVLAGLRRPRVSRADRLDDQARKGRALSDDEIKAVWGAASKSGAFGGLVQLALITGMRRGELAGLTWTDIASDRIGLHGARTKSGASHAVPLTTLVRSVLQAQPRTASPLVFPSARRKASAELSGWTQLVAGLVRASGVDFKLHDLRRTTRTMMARLGVAGEIAELAIGHAKGGLVGVYDKHDRWAERVAAFDTVSAHISALVDGRSPTTAMSWCHCVKTKPNLNPQSQIPPAQYREQRHFSRPKKRRAMQVEP